MPKEVEDKLKCGAKAKGYRPGSKDFGAYVYGTMRKLGWAPKRER